MSAAVAAWSVWPVRLGTTIVLFALATSSATTDPGFQACPGGGRLREHRSRLLLRCDRLEGRLQLQRLEARDGVGGGEPDDDRHRDARGAGRHDDSDGRALLDVRAARRILGDDDSLRLRSRALHDGRLQLPLSELVLRGLIPQPDDARHGRRPRSVVAHSEEVDDRSDPDQKREREEPEPRRLARGQRRRTAAVRLDDRRSRGAAVETTDRLCDAPPARARHARALDPADPFVDPLRRERPEAVPRRGRGRERVFEV